MHLPIAFRDPRQIGIETGVSVAVEATDWVVQEHARNRLHQDVHKIASPAATEYVLTRLEQQPVAGAAGTRDRVFCRERQY